MPQKCSASDYTNKKKYCSYACVDANKLVGPEGPQGPGGPTGPQGPQGPTGPSNNFLQYSINTDIRDIGTEFYFVGVNDSVATAQSGNNYTTDFSVNNNHVYLNIIAVATLNPSPSVTISGTSVDDNVPTASDTETITLAADGLGGYKTSKKWYLVTDISFTNVTPSNYDISTFNSFDFASTDVKITGYSLKALSDNSTNDCNITFQIIKVNSGTNVQLTDLENITVDGKGGTYNRGEIIDTKRGTRNYTQPNITTPDSMWLNNKQFVLKQSDFDTFFTADENHILGSSGESILLKIESSDILDRQKAPTFVVVYVFYENL